MKDKLIYIVYAVLAALCLAGAITGLYMEGIYPFFMAFPFAQVGLGLRSLSLSGSVGNIFAIILYCMICLSPGLAIFRLWKKENLRIEDSLLGLLSILLFIVLYKMINPGLISPVFGGMSGDLSFAKSFLSSFIYSVFFTYLLLRAVRLFFESDMSSLHKYMFITLGIVNALFVYAVFGAGVNISLASFKALREGNLGNGGSLGPDYIFLVLKFITYSIPFIFNFLIVTKGMSLLKSLESDPYSEETSLRARGLAKICRVSLITTLLSALAFNVLQLMFSGLLLNIDNTIQIPVFSIAFVLGALIFSRLIAKTREIKEDNDSII